MSSPPPDPTASSARPDPTIDDAWNHRDDLVLYARRLLGRQGESAEDIVQEAFLRLHERAVSDGAIRDPRPWLFRVTRNLALDERRRAQRGDAARVSLGVVATEPMGPHEVLQGREEVRHVLGGLGSLPPRERRTVLLAQAGLAPPAIARRMQTTTNAVHQSLFRARRRLREARAAAWGLVPLPVIRLLLRAANTPVLDRLPPLDPGSGGRLVGGAGVAGLAAAALIGGGVVADPPLLHHPTHHRASAVAPDPAAAAAPPGASTPLRRSTPSAVVDVARARAPVAREVRVASDDLPESESAASDPATSARVDDGSEVPRPEPEDGARPRATGPQEGASGRQVEEGRADDAAAEVGDRSTSASAGVSTPDAVEGAAAAASPDEPQE